MIEELVDQVQQVNVFGGNLAQNCDLIPIRAERQLGEMLREQPMNRGGWIQHNASCGTISEPQDIPPTLSDIGIDKELSSAQQIAAVSEKPHPQGNKRARLTAAYRYGLSRT